MSAVVHFTLYVVGTSGDSAAVVGKDRSRMALSNLTKC